LRFLRTYRVIANSLKHLARIQLAFETVGLYACIYTTHCVQERCRTWRHTPVPSQEKMDIWVRAAEDEYEALDAQRETWQMMVSSWLKVRKKEGEWQHIW